MAIPQATIANNPYLKRDANNNVIQSSSGDLAFRGEYTGNNLIYKGLARPGASESATVWQIAKLAYDVNDNLLSVTWPQDGNGHATSEYQFSWTNRATYTYS